MKSLIERWRALRFAWGTESRIEAAELRYRRHRPEAPRLDRASSTVALRTGPEGGTPCHGCEYCVRACPAEALRVDIVEGEEASAVIALQHLCRREGEGDEPKRARPGLVVAAFVLVPWMVLVGGVLDSEAPAPVTSEAVEVAASVEEAPVGELLAVLLVAVGLAATVALTAGRRGGLDR